MIDFLTATLRETMQYFTNVPWGGHYEDDKYFSDEELEDNFIVFYTYTFAHLGLPRPSRAQYEMAIFVSDRSNPHRMMMAERGLSKSLTSQIYAVWRFLRDVDEKILVLSSKSGRAKNYTGFVKKIIGLLPITRNMTPRHNMERTSGESFDLAGATPSDSPSMYASGAGNAITGMRASLLIIDDVETPLTVVSAALTERVQASVDEANNLLMSGKDESITLCTPHSMSSIYIGWIDKGYVPFIIPAEYPESDANYFGGLAPYIKERIANNPEYIGQAVDERLNKDFLMSKKMRIGKSKYKLQYMIDVSDADDLRYPLKLSDLVVMDVDDEEGPLRVVHSSMPDNNLHMKHNGFKQDKLYGPSFTSDERLPYEMKLMSIDPSGRGADEIGITLLYSLNTRLFAKKIAGIQGGYDESVMENIANLCAIHKITTLLVESNFGDGAFLKMLEPYMRKMSPMTEIDEVNVTGQKEVRIIDALEPLMNQHRLIVDKSTLDKDQDTSLVYSFTHQLTKITKERGSLRHDDRLDSLANAVIYMLDKMGDDDQFGMDNYLEDEMESIMKQTEEIFHDYFGWGGEDQVVNY